MGLSSSKTTTGPSKQALPYLQSASSAVQGAYNDAQPTLKQVSGSLFDQFNGYNSNLGADLAPAQAYNADVLGGKYLSASNPYLTGMIDQTNNDVMDRVNALFSRAGQTGSSRQIGELGKQLANNETNLRYGDYTNQLARMDQAASTAASLSGARNSEYQTLAGLGTTAATLPLANAQTLASSLGGLWGNSQTTKQSGGLGQMLLSAAANAAGAIAASEPALKRNIEYLGTGDHGLNVYAFDYIDPPSGHIAAFMPRGRQIGVMADEVAALRPDALGPTIGGYRTVDYGRL